MKRKKFLLQWLVLSLVGVSCAFASTATAQTQTHYRGTRPDYVPGYCGDGIVQNDPQNRNERGKNEECDVYVNTQDPLKQCDRECRYIQGSLEPKQDNGRLDRNPVPEVYGNDDLAKGIQAGQTKPNNSEQCDISFVLPANNAGKNGCITGEIDLRKGTYGPGCGNGVLEPNLGEECDDGNGLGGDGCSDDCKLEKTMRFRGNACGNGIKDNSEECDDGNTLGGDGCSPDCQLEPGVSTPSSPSPSSPISCHLTPVCGNGRVDIALGEQCDDGEGVNGTDQSLCRANCTLKSSPYFQLPGSATPKEMEKFMAWWKKPDTGNGTLGDDPQPPNELPTGSPGKYSFDGVIVGTKNGAQDLVKIYSDDTKKLFKVKDRGQRIVIARNGNDTKQISGVWLTGQKIDQIPNYPNAKVDLQALISSPDQNETWDDDMFGFVFGIQPGEQKEGTAPYFMLVWDSGSNLASEDDAYTGTINLGKTTCNPSGATLPKYSVRYGGLRLFQVWGNPTYEELWTMNVCPDNVNRESNGYTSSTRGVHIKEIPTTSNTPWNEFVNPMYRTPSFYYGTLDNNKKGTYGIEPLKEKLRLQWRVEFTADHLKVWSDNQLIMNVNRVELEKIRGTSGDAGNAFTWPKTGDVGFYFLGMDNIVADFRGFNAQIDSGQNYDDIDYNALSGAKSTVCRGYCGDGVVDQGEQCDDGNRIDGDGCSSKCEIETKPEVCKSIDGALVCYGGTIKVPSTPADGGTIDTLPQDPTIVGTYEGDPSAIKVTITNEDGTTTVCEGDAKKEPLFNSHNEPVVSNTGLWSFDTSTCANQPLATDGGPYKVKAKFLPPNGVGDEDDTLTAGPHKFNVSAQGPNLKVTSPAGYGPAAVKPSPTVEIAGTVDTNAANPTTVKVKWCEVNKTCNGEGEQVSLASNGGFTTNVQAKPGKEYDLTVTAERGGKTEVVTKKVVVDNRDPNAPEITSPPAGKTVVANGDNTLTIQGKVPEQPTGADETPSPEYVEISVQQDSGAEDGSKKILVPVNKDGTFEADYPMGWTGCSAEQLKDGCPKKIVAKTIDKAGNDSDPTTQFFNVIPQKGIITIDKPANGSKVSEKAIKKNGGELPVSGDINAHKKQPVTVDLYGTTKCECPEGATPCDMKGCDPVTGYKCNTSEKLGSKTVYAVNGKWDGNVKPTSALSNGKHYCTVATFKDAHPAAGTNPEPVKAQSIFEVVEGRKTVGRPTISLPGNSSCSENSCPDIKSGQNSGEITIKVTDPAGGGDIKDGDTAEIRVGDDLEHPLYTKTCTYKAVNGKLTCEVKVPVKGLDPDTEIHARTVTPEGDKSDWAEFPKPSTSDKNNEADTDNVTKRPAFVTTPEEAKEEADKPANSTVTISIKPPAGSDYPDGSKGEVVVGNPDNPVVKKNCTFVNNLCTVELPNNDKTKKDIKSGNVSARAKEPKAGKGNKKWSPWTKLNSKPTGITVVKGKGKVEVTVDPNKVDTNGGRKPQAGDTASLGQPVNKTCKLEDAGNGKLACSVDYNGSEDPKTVPVTINAPDGGGHVVPEDTVNVDGIMPGVKLEYTDGNKVKVTVDDSAKGNFPDDKIKLEKDGVTVECKLTRPAPTDKWTCITGPFTKDGKPFFAPAIVDVKNKDNEHVGWGQVDPVGGVTVTKNPDGSITVKVVDPKEAGDATGGRAPEAGDKVVLHEGDKTASCDLKNNLECNIPSDKADGIGDNVNVGFEGGNGLGTKKIPNVPVYSDALAGFVSGGCGCSSSDAPVSGLVSLLLAALGIFGIRRRKE